MTYSRSTAYNIEQRRQRLQRRIQHFEQRIAAIGHATTSQQKRALTIAVRCKSRAVSDLGSLPNAS